MTALVEVVEVRVPDFEHEQLWGCGIDQPKGGSERSTYSLLIRGWVLGRGGPVDGVELVHDGVVLRRLTLGGRRQDLAAIYPGVEGADTCEFFAIISSLSLPRRFEIVVQAVLPDQARVAVAVIAGRRAAVRSGFEPRLQPLMLTSTGRAGSTVMMNALGAHPQVAAYPPFEHEPRVASYWMQIFTTLSEPASYLRQIAPRGPLHGRWWLGREEPMPRGTRNEEIERWLAVEAVETLAGLCQGRIEALYEQIAARHGRSDAIYFAEKFTTNLVPALMWELYPEAREVVLVRDFRDVACSIVATRAKRKGVEPARDPRVVLGDIQGRTALIARVWEQRSQRAHLVRYEDLIRQPVETLEGVVEYLELDSTTGLVETMADALWEEGPAAKRHRTTPEAEASIGRWRRDLDPAMQREFEAALRPGLEMFGYSVETI